MIARSMLWERQFRGIGEQVITSFIKLQVVGGLGGRDVHFAANITYHWLEMTMCFRGFHQSICILLAGDPVKVNQGKVDG